MYRQLHMMIFKIQRSWWFLRRTIKARNFLKNFFLQGWKRVASDATRCWSGQPGCRYSSEKYTKTLTLKVAHHWANNAVDILLWSRIAPWMCGQYFDGMSNWFLSREMEQGHALPTPGIDLVLQHHKERVGKWGRIKTEGSSEEEEDEDKLPGEHIFVALDNKVDLKLIIFSLFVLLANNMTDQEQTWGALLPCRCHS